MSPIVPNVWPRSDWYLTDATSTTGYTTYGTAAGTSNTITYQDLMPVPMTGAPATHHVDWKYVADAATALGKALKAQNQWQKATARLSTKLAKQPPPPPVRQRAPLDFNRYINASDLLEEFIKFLGENDVRKGQVMELPLELFIKWLIIRAHEADNEKPPITLTLPAPKSKPRCIGCQKFIGKGVLVPFHNEQCASRYYRRVS